MGEAKASSSDEGSCTIGKYLTQRLVQAGATHCFTVPGDFNLLLLDEVLKEEKLRLVRCCNELNAGYAADGFSRATGSMAVLLVTYMVGSLSAINAVAGAYAEDLPVLCIVGGPNNSDRECCHLVHHTLGEIDFYRSAKCFEPVTAASLTIRYVGEAIRKIDEAVKTCLTRKKPVYLEIPCNLVQQKAKCWPQPVRLVPEIPVLPASDEESLSAALGAIIAMVDKADKVVIIAGPKLKPLNALEPFVALTRDLDCCVAVMPDAKGVFNEFDDNYLGYYWGSISSPSVLKALDDSDLIVYCGPRFNDYTTMGWTSTVNYDKSIVISVDHVHVRNVRYSYICLPTVLHRLAGNVSRKYNFVRTKSDEGGICTAKHQMEDPVSLSFLLEELQLTVGSGKYCSVVAETGDCWFIAEKLKVPPETMFCIQMQYGSIGWAVGASLGVGLMARQMGCGKLLSLIGDGSFQVSAQELSTIISEQLDVTILLINNASYTIEDQIHPGSYNQLINWKYTQLLDAFRGDRPAARSYFCKSNKDLKFALCDSYEHYGVALIECYMDKNECTEEMRKWGQHIAAANART